MQQKGLSSIIRTARTLNWATSKAFSNASFKRKDLQVTLTSHKKVKPKFDNSLKFGYASSDHILEIDWDAKQGWGAPKINPYHPFEIDPCNTTLHYAIECFEGYKVFVNPEGKLTAFRPDKNHERFKTSCARLCLPDFDANELWACTKELLKVDRDWIPAIDGFSCYVRPTAISMTNLLGVRAADKSKVFVVLSPVGPYFPDGFKPLKIYTENKHVRAYPGGAGHFKVGSNYGPTILISSEAEKKGYHQVLWLTEKYITEIGASNFFWVWINEKGEKELCTAPLTGLVLPGVTRDSVLALAREKKDIKVAERLVTIDDFIVALKEKRVLEAFGAGTAVTVCPVELLHYNGVDYKIPIDPKTSSGPICKEMNDKIKDIQYGRVKHPWALPVD